MVRVERGPVDATLPVRFVPRIAEYIIAHASRDRTGPTPSHCIASHANLNHSWYGPMMPQVIWSQEPSYWIGAVSCFFVNGIYVPAAWRSSNRGCILGDGAGSGSGSGSVFELSLRSAGLQSSLLPKEF